MSAHDGGVPDELAISFSRISPGRLAHAQALLDYAFGIAEHYGNIFLSVHPLADEKWNDDDVSRFCEVKTFADFGSFFEEYGVDPGVDVLRANQVGLVLDGGSRIFVLFGAVAGDKQRQILRFRRAREGIFFDNFAGAFQKDCGDAIVSADRFAVEEGLRAALLDTREVFHAFSFEAQLSGDYFVTEIAFADEERDNENPIYRQAGKDVFDFWVLFPKGFTHFGKESARTQLPRVLIHDIAGGVDHSRAVAE